MKSKIIYKIIVLLILAIINFGCGNGNGLDPVVQDNLVNAGTFIVSANSSKILPVTVEVSDDSGNNYTQVGRINSANETLAIYLAEGTYNFKYTTGTTLTSILSKDKEYIEENKTITDKDTHKIALNTIDHFYEQPGTLKITVSDEKLLPMEVYTSTTGGNDSYVLKKTIDSTSEVTLSLTPNVYYIKYVTKTTTSTLLGQQKIDSKYTIEGLKEYTRKISLGTGLDFTEDFSNTLGGNLGTYVDIGEAPHKVVITTSSIVFTYYTSYITYPDGSFAGGSSSIYTFSLSADDLLSSITSPITLNGDGTITLTFDPNDKSKFNFVYNVRNNWDSQSGSFTAKK